MSATTLIETLDRIQTRLDWWRRDIVYKAPEQLIEIYRISMLMHLEAVIKEELKKARARGEGDVSDDTVGADSEEAEVNP